LRAAISLAAEGLAEFRLVGLDGLEVLSPQEILRPIERGRRHIEPCMPDVAMAFAARLRGLELRAAELPPEPLGLTHGAFRYGQLLARGDRIVVLDLDSLCLAGAAVDPGSFLAGLDKVAARSPRLRPVLAACEATFLEALERDGHVHPEWLAWHRAAARLEHAIRSILSLDPDWPDRVATLLHGAAAEVPVRV
jgi:hypothetical protein